MTALRRSNPLAARISILVAIALLSAGLAPAEAGSTQRLRILRNPRSQAPAFVTGLDTPARSGSVRSVALGHLESNRARYHIPRPERVLHPADVIRAGDRSTVRFRQVHEGIPVFGGEYLVHLRSVDTRYSVESVNGDYFTDLDVDVHPRLGAGAAEELATRRARGIDASEVSSDGLTVLPVGRGVLAYRVTVRGSDRGRPVSRAMFINAHSGALVASYEELHYDGPVVASGTTSHGDSVDVNAFQRDDRFELRDKSRAMFDLFGPSNGQITTHDVTGESFLARSRNLEKSSDDNFGDGAAVDAHVGAGHFYEFFSALGRQSIDGAGMTIRSAVHFSPDGAPFPNAFWDPRALQVTYGDGKASEVHPFSADLDIVGHELTHGVIQFSAGLYNFNQSGAMNEAYADYFGNAIDVDVTGTSMSDPEAGFIGEDLCKVADPSTLSCPIRDLNDGRTTDDYLPALLDFDNGAIHDNATIYGGALWDIREVLGPAKADRYIYVALNEFTTPTDDFLDGRNSVLAAAESEGAEDSDLEAIRAAFDGKAIVPGWDTSGNVDSEILRPDVLPVGFLTSPPQASTDRFVIGDYAHPENFCCEPMRLFVGSLNGSGAARAVGEHRDASTLNDEQPDISGSRVVWAHFTGGRRRIDIDLHWRALGGRVREVADARGFQWWPSIDADLVAWEDTRSLDTDIWARRLDGPARKIAGAPGEQLMPQVSGNWIVWWDMRGREPRIGMSNFKTGKTKHIDAAGFLSPPAAGGDYAYFYEDAEFGFEVALKRVRLGSGKVRTLIREDSTAAPVWLNPASASLLTANRDHVVYTDESGYLTGGADPGSYGRDLFILGAAGGGRARVTDNRGDQAYPSMGPGRRVLWLDAATGRTDLMTRRVP